MLSPTQTLAIKIDKVVDLYYEFGETQGFIVRTQTTKGAGTRILARVKGEIQPTLGVNMTTITYRGVKYDAEQ